MRITNIDTLSAYIDRLITERIKWYFFLKDSDSEKVEHQEKVIYAILDRISQLFEEVYATGEYQYESEKRTFGLLIGDLTMADIMVGEYDRQALDSAKNPPRWECMQTSIHGFRNSNEIRSMLKNLIDEYLTQYQK